MARENSNQNPGKMPARLPLPTPEPEPADPLLPNPPAPAEKLVWRKDYGKNKDDDHKVLYQFTFKQDTPPRDGPANSSRADTPKASNTVKGMLSPPAETKPSAVFDATRWTHIRFAFGSSGDSNEPPFTFKMKTEGSAEDPRNSSMPRNQSKGARLFNWPKVDPGDDGPALSENPRPVKLIKGSGSLARTGGGR